MLLAAEKWFNISNDDVDNVDNVDDDDDEADLQDTIGSGVSDG